MHVLHSATRILNKYKKEFGLSLSGGQGRRQLARRARNKSAQVAITIRMGRNATATGVAIEFLITTRSNVRPREMTDKKHTA